MPYLVFSSESDYASYKSQIDERWPGHDWTFARYAEGWGCEIPDDPALSRVLCGGRGGLVYPNVSEYVPPPPPPPQDKTMDDLVWFEITDKTQIKCGQKFLVNREVAEMLAASGAGEITESGPAEVAEDQAANDGQFTG